MLNNNIIRAIEDYKKVKNIENWSPKLALFDMDGVLFDTMPAHSKAWKETMARLGVASEEYEFYLTEGQTAPFTIDQLFQRELGRSANESEIKEIYKVKTELFVKYNSGNKVEGIDEVISIIDFPKTVVTGSSQPSLIGKLEGAFSSAFDLDKMVTGKDVKIGKPNPEPYLKALEKANCKPEEAIVIENAPMGVRSAVAAGIFTIVVNTGILKDEVLLNEKPNILYHNMKDLAKDLQSLLNIIK